MSASASFASNWHRHAFRSFSPSLRVSISMIWRSKPLISVFRSFLLQGSYSDESRTLALAKRYPHIHLDVTRRGTPHIVRFLTEEIGVDRVLFGTNAPQSCVRPAMNAVFVADLARIRYQRR